MSEVIRIGSFIYRKSGPWSHIQQFLRHLHTQGFHKVPEPFGFDEEIKQHFFCKI